MILHTFHKIMSKPANIRSQLTREMRLEMNFRQIIASELGITAGNFRCNKSVNYLAGIFILYFVVF